MAGGDIIWGGPLYFRGDVKMFEAARPGFDGIGAEDGIPMQLVYGKAGFFDGRENLREAHAVDVRFPTEEETIELQGDAAFHRAAECFCQEVGNDQALVVDAKAAAAGDAGSVEDREIGEGNVVAGITAGAFELSRSVGGFAADVGKARRRLGRTQVLAQVEKVHPPAIAKSPFRVGEIVHLRLRVQSRAACVENALLEDEALARQSEFCGEVRGYRQKTVGRKLERLPIEGSEIRGVVQRAARFQCKLQIATFHGEGFANVVV